MRSPLLVALLLAGCTPWVEPTGLPELPATVVGTTPEDGARDVPSTTALSVRWDRVPRGAELRMRTALGDIAGRTEGDDTEALRRFVPELPLVPDTGYVVEVEWADGSAQFSFSTSLVGQALDEDELDGLPGQTWAVQPLVLNGLEGIPGLPQAEDLSLLLAVHEDAEPESGAVHLVLAQAVTGTSIQDQCAETSLVTAGPDGALATDDDAPASWDNPRLTAAGGRFAAGNGSGVDGVSVVTPPLRDWTLDASVIPEREGLYIHRFSAQLPTGFLDGLIPAGGPLGGSSFCEVYAELTGRECVECLSGVRGSQCLPVELVDVMGEPRATDLRIRECQDIISSAKLGFICDGADARYDADGDGVYELCPAYVQP